MNYTYERTGFQYKREQDCVNEPTPDRCKYHDFSTFIGEYFPANENRDYFGRGPMHLRWSTQYGLFSKAYYEEEFFGEDQLLTHPHYLQTNKNIGFASALWFYMTPIYPKTSAHEAITGLTIPTEIDIEDNVGHDFGTTIVILAQDLPENYSEYCYDVFLDEEY